MFEDYYQSITELGHSQSSACLSGLTVDPKLSFSTNERIFEIFG